jgi:hypothetical protein
MKHVYVYNDMDHYETEVFSSLTAAKAYAEERWDDLVWEKNGSASWSLGEYVRIHKCKIRGNE